MSELKYPKILVVDANNQNPRAVTYEEANELGLWKRASRVFLVNESGKILLQKRSQYISKPLLLDNSAAGHVDEGEEYIDAAVRELNEELGVVVTPEDLQELPMVRETRFFAQNYLLHVPNDIEITFDPQEVAECYWYTLNEVDDLVSKHSELCSPSLIEVWPQIRDSISV